jgi:BspA type Leucine rich repeat region (6 copies)
MRNLLLASLFLISAFQTALGQWQQEGDWTYIVENGGATIIASSARGAVTIPSVLGGYDVKKVGDDLSAYSFLLANGFVTSITIPNSVTSIGNYAFRDCWAITSITIPNSVTSIGMEAFYNCQRLASVTIPSSVTSIGDSAFSYCIGLTSITIPSSVTSIGDSAFRACIVLTSITIPSSVTSIGGGVFSECASLTSITIPNSVTSIGDNAFSYCTGLTSIIIPYKVSSLGQYVFGYCTNLANIRFEPNSSLITIGQRAFESCASLARITIPLSVTSIGDRAFYLCPNISLVELPSLFQTTYGRLALTAAKVSFYDATSPVYLMGQQSVISDPSAHNLYTATQYTANFNAGRDSVLNSPNSNGLYTTSQIQNMAVGDLVLTKNVGGTFTLNYDIEQSADLQTWTTYAPLSLPLTGLPTDKAFVRIKAKQ